jgi:hypothetical protein
MRQTPPVVSIGKEVRAGLRSRPGRISIQAAAELPSLTPKMALYPYAYPYRHATLWYSLDRQRDVAANWHCFLGVNLCSCVARLRRGIGTWVTLGARIGFMCDEVESLNRSDDRVHAGAAPDSDYDCLHVSSPTT